MVNHQLWYRKPTTTIDPRRARPVCRAAPVVIASSSPCADDSERASLRRARPVCRAALTLGRLYVPTSPH